MSVQSQQTFISIEIQFVFNLINNYSSVYLYVVDLGWFRPTRWGTTGRRRVLVQIPACNTHKDTHNNNNNNIHNNENEQNKKSEITNPHPRSPVHMHYMLIQFDLFRHNFTIQNTHTL